MTAKLIAPYGEIPIDCEPGQVSDGYHTFDELYEHRCLLFALLINSFDEYALPGDAFKTRRNAAGEELPGWFIAGIRTVKYGQVTYYLPDKYWGMVWAPELERNADYDGHTVADVAQRLAQLVRDAYA